jgi:hypothetical protein
MSDEQDVQAPGWVDPRDGRTGATAAAVVPGQRTEGEPVQPTPPVLETPVVGAPPGSNAPAEERSAGAPRAEGPPADVPRADVPHEPRSTPYPTTPVNVGVRPRPRMPRGDPLIRMGPWAPVAGATVGLVLGILVVLLLAPVVVTFDQRLALVFVVLGLCLLGAGGTLLADEVRLLRRGAQAAEARASGAGVIAGLLNGLTPARLLITASAFVLLLSAYVTSNS